MTDGYLFYYQCMRLCEVAVYVVRRKLREEYNISSGPYYHYCGLCDKACDMVVSELERLLNSNIQGYSTIKSMTPHTKHGEQKHLPTIDSLSWPRQHTWLYVEFKPVDVEVDIVGLYIDPTSEQFRDIYPYIPTSIISTEEPKWYYDDRKNPLWNGITKKLNDWIQFNKTITEPDLSRRKVKEGIIEFLQYDVWGYISDVIHYIIVKMKERQG